MIAVSGFESYIRELEEPIQDVVVCDNAPVHVSLQDVMEEEEFEGAQFLRLAPYSAPPTQLSSAGV